MIRTLFTGFSLLFAFILFSPDLAAQSQQDRPKLIVGVVVDQMRWDYLYRYQDRYTEGGFKRMLKRGFTCENMHIPYSPTATGPGHACAYTGSVPAVHGIVGNQWYDRNSKKKINCVEDSTVQLVGVESGALRSPKNLLVTTIGDELKLSNNMRSKVIGVSFKDRGAILPAGHLSDGSFWYDGSSGRFITSTYFMDDLPQWVKDFNNRKLPDQYLTQTWEPLYPIETYKQSTEDDKPYEGRMIGKETATFPYDYSDQEGKYGVLSSSIYGNTLTFEMAKAAIEGENLGMGDFTDMLAISFSATDGLGHTVGPNAIEVEDMYLRLDKEFEAFFRHLDSLYGENGYLFFITADHGVSQSPGYLLENNLPAGVFTSDYVDEINTLGSEKYGIDKTVLSVDNYEIYLNWDEIYAPDKNISKDELLNDIIHIVLQHDGVVDAWVNKDLANAPWPEITKKMFINGYNAQRGGDISIIFRPGWKGGSEKGATHGLWYPFDSHLPLVWMGWNVPQGYTNRRVEMTDIAPTIAAMLKIQMPSGSIGHPILEITDKN